MPQKIKKAPGVPGNYVRYTNTLLVAIVVTRIPSVKAVVTL